MSWLNNLNVLLSTAYGVMSGLVGEGGEGAVSQSLELEQDLGTLWHCCN